MKYSFLIGIAFIFCCSCNDFLDKRPSKSSDIVPSTIEDLETILAGMWRSDETCPELILLSGDIDLNTEIEQQRPGTYIPEYLCAAMGQTEESANYKDYMWLYRHENIFRSNLALFYLDKISTSESEKERIKAKACFRRAYSYMELLNVYTLPYNEKTKNEMGLTLCTQTTFDYSLTRASLEATYAFVEKDLEEARKIQTPLSSSFGQGSNVRVTNAAAMALSSRFYLMKNDYANAEKYAKLALDLYGEDKIVDYTQIGQGDYTEPVELETVDSIEMRQVVYPNTYMGYDETALWTEDYWYGSVETDYAWGFSIDFVPSSDCIANYDTDGSREFDTRFKYFMVANYAYLNGINVDVYYWMRPRQYSLTVPEMVLTIAECEAREGDWSVAIDWVNKLRAKRILPGGQVKLSVSNKEDAIALVLRERRREVGPYMRLFDIRRYNSNDYSADDVTVTKKFYSFNADRVDMTSPIKEYILKPGDRHYAAPIPATDIASGKGQLIQNNY